MIFSSQVTQPVTALLCLLCFNKRLCGTSRSSSQTLRLVHFAAVALDDTPFAGVQNVTRHARAVLQYASLPSNHAHNSVETLPALFER